MLLKTLFILGDIGYLNQNLNQVVNLVNNKINVDDRLVLLGDNFYDSGIINNDDPLISKYQEIFKDVNNPKYSILGNHDYLENPLAQIKNQNWIMDDWYYKKEFDNIDLYFLDTNQFNLDWVKEERLKEVHNLDSKTLIKNQIDWFKNELNKDLKKKKIVFGHYPVITNGRYVNQVDKIYNDLIDVFKEYNINIYISGHEHNIQYIKRDIDGFDFNQIIVGSSSEFRIDCDTCFEEDMLDNTDIFYGKLVIEDDYIQIEYYNIKDELKYKYKIKL